MVFLSIWWGHCTAKDIPKRGDGGAFMCPPVAAPGCVPPKADIMFPGKRFRPPVEHSRGRLCHMKARADTEASRSAATGRLLRVFRRPGGIRPLAFDGGPSSRRRL